MTRWRRSAEAGQRPAMRLTHRAWRDPRALTGIVLVVASTALGARVVAAGDDTVAYWTLTRSVVPGDSVSDGDLTVSRVRLPRSSAGRYVRADEPPPADVVWTGPAEAGSLVPTEAWQPRAERGVSELPLTVPAGAAPPDLARGDLVDVWAGPGPEAVDIAPAARILRAVRVADPGEEDPFCGGAGRVVVVGLDRPASAQGIALLASGRLTLVRVGP